MKSIVDKTLNSIDQRKIPEFGTHRYWLFNGKYRKHTEINEHDTVGFP